MQPDVGPQVSLVQLLLSLQFRAPAPTQLPTVLQVSLGVQMLLSLQTIPANSAEPWLVHWPVVVLQLSAVQGLLSSQPTTLV
jgi:hypothetical protein